MRVWGWWDGSSIGQRNFHARMLICVLPSVLPYLLLLDSGAFGRVYDGNVIAKGQDGYERPRLHVAIKTVKCKYAYCVSSALFWRSFLIIQVCYTGHFQLTVGDIHELFLYFKNATLSYLYYKFYSASPPPSPSPPPPSPSPPPLHMLTSLHVSLVEIGFTSCKACTI